MRAFLALALWFLVTVLPARAAEPSVPAPDVGWAEVVVSVADLDRATAFLEEVAGWQVRSRGPVGQDQLDPWRLPKEASAEEVLMHNPGDAWGLVRLVRFSGVSQVAIRPHAMPWETGGIFSLMVRTRDLDGALRRAEGMGYGAYSEPYAFEFPPVALRNIVLRGPDGINLALYERTAPPLTGWETITKLSAPFNSMQMVRDRDAAREFYTRVLGYGVFANGDFLDPEPRATNFALPNNMATTVPRRYAILSTPKAEWGRVEAMAFPGIEGRDFADRALPPNLGPVVLRFRVTDLDARLAAAKAADAPLWAPVRELALPPYGRVRGFIVRSPDGVLNEIFQTLP